MQVLYRLTDLLCDEGYAPLGQRARQPASLPWSRMPIGLPDLGQRLLAILGPSVGLSTRAPAILMRPDSANYFTPLLKSACQEIGHNTWRFGHMTYAVIILSKAQKYLDTLEERAIINIWSNIAELKKNPYRSRPLVDIIKLRGFKSPSMYRLRVGRHRLEYFIDENDKTITVTNAFLRSGDSDYR